jgi:hypothetical protein
MNNWGIGGKKVCSNKELKVNKRWEEKQRKIGKKDYNHYVGDRWE